MSAQPKYTALTYAEVRDWAFELGTFTASDLAFSMGVDQATGVRCVNALCRQGVCANTGDQIDGPHGYETIVTYLPPPPGPSSYDAGPDPVAQAISQAGRIAVVRGLPVRIRTERKNRRGMSTPGQRQKMKNREREYQKQQDAKATAAAAQKSKAQKAPKWKKQK